MTVECCADWAQPGISDLRTLVKRKTDATSVRRADPWFSQTDLSRRLARAAAGTRRIPDAEEGM